ncbi:hypothetical protein [Microcoleus sp. CAWBG50]|uniref:hypothetical protein n=1 Tax=Microcoleus sp. CAWBG50 TaxID=2841646 RepID=UPI0025DB1E9A|nr:hypothetical protein [Microcoleus sp. CAWBG50]
MEIKAWSCNASISSDSITALCCQFSVSCLAKASMAVVLPTCRGCMDDEIVALSN